MQSWPDLTKCHGKSNVPTILCGGWGWVSDDVQTGRALVCHLPSWVGSITGCWKSERGIAQGSAQAYTAPAHLGLRNTEVTCVWGGGRFKEPPGSVRCGPAGIKRQQVGWGGFWLKENTNNHAFILMYIYMH